jgi:hypothetical protein
MKKKRCMDAVHIQALRVSLIPQVSGKSIQPRKVQNGATHTH